MEFFNRYPLRAKKQAQFTVWANAVHEMAKGRDRSDDFIMECRKQLAELREYVSPELSQYVTAPENIRYKRVYGEVPVCLCGCGLPTHVVSHSNSVRHPNNPNFCAYARGHNLR